MSIQLVVDLNGMAKIQAFITEWSTNTIRVFLSINIHHLTITLVDCHKYFQLKHVFREHIKEITAEINIKQ